MQGAVQAAVAAGRFKTRGARGRSKSSAHLLASEDTAICRHNLRAWMRGDGRARERRAESERAVRERWDGDGIQMEMGWGEREVERSRVRG